MEKTKVTKEEFLLFTEILLYNFHEFEKKSLIPYTQIDTSKIKLELQKNIVDIHRKKRISGNEIVYHCSKSKGKVRALLQHFRNSVSHNRIYTIKINNEKYYWFEDFYFPQKGIKLYTMKACIHIDLWQDFFKKIYEESYKQNSQISKK